jgi:hypothetical protein
MLKAAKALKEKGRKVMYVAVGAGAVYAEQFAVDAVDVGLNVEELFAAVVSTDSEAVFIRGLGALATLYGPAVLYTVLRILLQTARGGRAVVISLRDLHDLDILFDVIVKMEEKTPWVSGGPAAK